MEAKKVGVFVGRLCPIHVGHMETIDKMIEECGEENSLIVLGSVGQKVTFRVLFSYWQRRQWIRSIYGENIRIVGLPDFPNDNESWFRLLSDLIYASFSHLAEGEFKALDDDVDVVFYGGSVDDTEIFSGKGYPVRIVDRTSMPVSATVIRDMALRGMDVSPFLHPHIKDDFLRKFAKVMEESEKWDTPSIQFTQVGS